MVYLHKPLWVTQRGSLALTLDISEKGVYCRFLVCVTFQFDVSLLFMLYNFSFWLCDAYCYLIYILILFSSFICLFILVHLFRCTVKLQKRINVQ